MARKRDDWALFGLLGLLGLLAFAGEAKAKPVPTPVEPDEDEDLDLPITPVDDDLVPVVDFEPEDSIADIVDRYVDPTGSRTGALYQVRAGDNPSSVAARAMGVLRGNAAIAPYVAAMATPQFNQLLYDVVWFEDTYGKRCTYGKISRRYTASIGGERLYIGDAFCRKHAPIYERMRSGKPIYRATNEDGGGRDPARRYGLIWLPKVTSIDPLTIPDPNMPAELADVIDWG